MQNHYNYVICSNMLRHEYNTTSDLTSLQMWFLVLCHGTYTRIGQMTDLYDPRTTCNCHTKLTSAIFAWNASLNK